MALAASVLPGSRQSLVITSKSLQGLSPRYLVDSLHPFLLTYALRFDKEALLREPPIREFNCGNTHFLEMIYGIYSPLLCRLLFLDLLASANGLFLFFFLVKLCL
ncbi:UNVERIFIED_CONTAM: hypothetical protein K2H54_041992 [Gekko kuhli]